MWKICGFFPVSAIILLKMVMIVQVDMCDSWNDDILFNKYQISEEKNSFCTLINSVLLFSSLFKWAHILYRGTLHFLVIMFRLRRLIKMSGLSIWMVSTSIDPLERIRCTHTHVHIIQKHISQYVQSSKITVWAIICTWF